MIRCYHVTSHSVSLAVDGTRAGTGHSASENLRLCLELLLTKMLFPHEGSLKDVTFCLCTMAGI